MTLERDLAERVMRWKVYGVTEYQEWKDLHFAGKFAVYEDNARRIYVSRATKELEGDLVASTWSPRTDMNDAYEIVSRFRFFVVTKVMGRSDKYKGICKKSRTGPQVSAFGKTPGEAICAAAAKACGIHE